MIADCIARDLGISADFVRTVAASASHRYKSYFIKKKSGGHRQINHPSLELKALQYWLTSHVFCHLPVHEAATAYKQGSSIGINARRHVGQNYLRRL